MPKHIITIGIALAAALLGARPAAAADRCFTLPGLSGFVTYALKSFSTPGKSKCKPLTGFTTLESPAFLLSGTACTKSDGTLLRLALIGTPAVVGPVKFEAGCAIPLPALTGGSCRGTYEVGSTTFGFTTSIDLAPCVGLVP
jgi:hypothetical protein